MALKKGDFIEIDFTGKIKDTGEIFDTTKKDDAKKANLDIKNLKPFVFCIGEKMLPEGFDNDFVGKDVSKSYVLELKPEQGFGERKRELIKMIPTKLFHEQKIEPQRGMQLNLDGQIVKVLSSSGGRTLVDFNHPLAGKEVVYEYKINKQIQDEKEKIEAVQEFLFRQKFDFEVKENKIIFKVEERIEPIIKMFSKKLKEILGKEVEAKVISKENKKSGEKEKKEVKKKQENKE